jgi:hypothetical protein
MSNVRASDTRVSNLLVFSFLLVCLLPFELAWDLLARFFRLVLANERRMVSPFC